MDAIEEIKAKLQQYPQARYEIDGARIRVLPTSENGFAVEFADYQGEEEYEVRFNGWHEPFSDKGEALNCFTFGLSTKCRLREFWRGNFVYKWIVEFRKDDEWMKIALLVFSSFLFGGGRQSNCCKTI